jgi:hypothetical protein
MLRNVAGTYILNCTAAGCQDRPGQVVFNFLCMKQSLHLAMAFDLENISTINILDSKLGKTLPVNIVSFSFLGWGETESTWYVGHYFVYGTTPDDTCRWWWMWSSRWNENWQGKPKYSEKTYPSATLSTTNLTWPDLGSNHGRHGGKPTTDYLSCMTALRII